MEDQKYTIPKLCSFSGDLSKSWYVYFVFTEDGVSKQFRLKKGINYLRTKKDRERAASTLIAFTLDRLKTGWRPYPDDTNCKNTNVTITDAFDSMLLLKKAYITVRSYKTYFEQTRLFKKWLVLRKFDKVYVHNFTTVQVRMYFDWLLLDKKYCGKTCNNHRACLRAFFNAFLEREIISTTPMKGIKQFKQETGKATIYSAEEQDRIEKYLIENNKDFFYVTRFIKYAFLRRSELSGLKIKHINWAGKTITVPSDSAKSRTQDSVTIPKTLENYILEMGILDKDPELYVFGKHYIPSYTRLNREDDFTKYQQEVNKLLKVNPNCSFYSYKSTGVCELYELTHDPYTVMRQCRHSDIKTTLIYLRSLGMGVNEEVRAW